MLILPTLTQITIGDFFRSKYFFNDLFFYIAAFALLFSNRLIEPPKLDYFYILYRFSTMLPICYILVYFGGLGYELYGSYYFFYGHLVNFVIIFGAFYKLTIDKKYFSLSSVAILINLAVFLKTMQSAHLVLIILTLCISLLAYRKIVYLAYTLAIIVAVVFIYHAAPSGSWVKLKVGQVVKASEIVSGSNTFSDVNSLGVRFASLHAISNENTVFTTLFGRGIGSIYTDTEHVFSYLDLHEFTFPKDEVDSGEFHLVHETLVRIFMQVGIIGLIVTMLIVFSALRKIETSVCTYLSVIFFVFLWMSSVQFCGFITIWVFLMLKAENHTVTPSVANNGYNKVYGKNNETLLRV
ncbi:hypothetical protein NH568_10075 [Pseudoalteromonas sp. XMcav2-N]|nr:hypothetical protein [Pseudoalteromonas sp. XMcav2-N]